MINNFVVLRVDIRNVLKYKATLNYYKKYVDMKKK